MEWWWCNIWWWWWCNERPDQSRRYYVRYSTVYDSCGIIVAYTDELLLEDKDHTSTICSLLLRVSQTTGRNTMDDHTDNAGYSNKNPIINMSLLETKTTPPIVTSFVIKCECVSSSGGGWHHGNERREGIIPLAARQGRRLIIIIDDVVNMSFLERIKEKLWYQTILYICWESFESLDTGDF